MYGSATSQFSVHHFSSYSINANVHPSVCLYVCLSVRFRGKRDFLGPYIRSSCHFLCALSSCSWASILQIFCPSVCRSGYKRQNNLWLLMDDVILVVYIIVSSDSVWVSKTTKNTLMVLSVSLSIYTNVDQLLVGLFRVLVRSFLSSSSWSASHSSVMYSLVSVWNTIFGKIISW